MKKIVIIMIALITVFTGCARNEFTVSSARLRQDRTDDVRYLTFSFYPSDEDEEYAVTLTSPDGNLTWKGNCTRNDEGLLAFDMAITPGTDFPSGDWSWMIYSSNGTEKEGVTQFPGALDVEYSLDWPNVSWDVEGTVYGEKEDGSRHEVESPLDLTGYKRLTHTDSNFNTYSFTIGE